MTHPSDPSGGQGTARDVEVTDDLAAESSHTSTTDVARDQAADMKDTAVEASKNVAATAKDEAANVAAEATTQARDLFSSVTSEIESQAGVQQQKIAGTVSSLVKELAGMAEASTESGPLTDLAKQAARRGDSLAQWLENHEPRDVLSQVTAFGRRRPVMFLGLCFLAGIAAGRITRAAAKNASDEPSTGGADTAATRPALDSGPANQPRPPDWTAPTGAVTDDQLRADAQTDNPPASAWNEPPTDRPDVAR